MKKGVVKLLLIMVMGFIILSFIFFEVRVRNVKEENKKLEMGITNLKKDIKLIENNIDSYEEEINKISLEISDKVEESKIWERTLEKLNQALAS